ncbi:MAG TPA: helix-turn-helix domain-containing protein [Candidatus Angelobacter sp.]|nr:helix-turn-helix domain-containing protein [Candidatus Angelobacter sp.]
MKPSTQDRNPSARESCLASVAGSYREWQPVGPLASHLACTWLNALPESPPPPLQVIPDGCVDIIWTGQSLGVAGPDTEPIFESFPACTMIVGVRFLPGAAPPWLGVPASEIVNDRLPLQEFWGADARRLAARLEETRDPRAAADLMLSALVARLPRPGLFDPAARSVADAFARDEGGRVGVGDLTASLGLSERTLRRRCESAFGYGPKTLERILRFQRFLRLLRRPAAPALAELAAASGFADQAHLTREVRRLGGLTPAGFMAQLAA